MKNMSDKERKILVIDGDERLHADLCAAFRTQGWACVCAKEGRAGLDLLHEEGPDLVLVEAQLPDMDGIGAVAMIRELDHEVPIICVAGNESQDLADRVFAAGAGDFVLKPIRTPDMISRIRLHVRLLELNERLNSGNEVPAQAPKAKGIGAVTLKLIQSAFRTNGEYLTVETIAERTGLAYQTTYRYLQHLASHELLDICHKYGKVGRPKQKYRLKQRDPS